jgi:HEAT repeat protein
MKPRSDMHFVQWCCCREAARTLGEIGDQRAVAALLVAEEQDQHISVREAAADALVKIVV